MKGRHFTTICLCMFFCLTFSCGKKQEKVSAPSKEKAAAIEAVKNEASSRITFPLDFPVNDLYKLINASLPSVLVEDTLRLKKKDYIALKIVPTGRALLASYGNNLDVSIPMRVSAEVEKKVLGIKIHKPITTKIRADMNTKLTIDEDWNLTASCRIQKIHWIEPPTIEVLGIKVNLQKKVEKKLKEKAAVIEETVCNALQKLVPLRKQVEKIWALIGNTHRVGTNPIEIWLTSKGSVFSGYFSKNVKDTLRVIIHTESDLFITPVSGLEFEKQPMPKNTLTNLESENELDIKMDVYLPYDKVNEVLSSKLEGTTFSYEGASISLTNFVTNTAQRKLHLQFDIQGAVEATVDAYAFPTLDLEKRLVIESISYEVTSENKLLNIAEWAVRDQLTTFLKQSAQVPLAHILDSLDFKIVSALNKSKAGGKVEVEMDFTSIASDTLIFSEEGLQWFFDVRGNAHAYLTDQLLQ